MKKQFFSFLFLMGLGFFASAQSHISIQMLGATYTASPTVKFRVSWSSVPTITGQIHNAEIWVWVDFLKVNADNTTSGNTWTRAEITTAPTVNSSPTSTATLEATTNKGFWLNGVTGSYSATVTAALANVPANTKFNWCAYTSDCPPFVIANNGTYTLQGTPPFTLKAADGTTQIVEGKTLPASSLTIAAVTLTDKTECPSLFCAYTGSDLYRDATHLCGHRPTEARNWEAWIKDTDNELYRIVQYSDDVWWWADDYRGSSGYVLTCDGIRQYRQSGKNSACPSGWKLPTNDELINRFCANMQNDQWGGALTFSIYWHWPAVSNCGTLQGLNRSIMLSSDATTGLIFALNDPQNPCANCTGAVGECRGGVRCIRQL